MFCVVLVLALGSLWLGGGSCALNLELRVRIFRVYGGESAQYMDNKGIRRDYDSGCSFCVGGA